MEASAITPEQQLAWEAERRPRAAAAPAVSGLLLLGGGVFASLALRDVPHIGLVQTFAGDLCKTVGAQARDAVCRATQHGVNPRTTLVQFLHDHATDLVVGAVITGLGTLLIAYVLLYLFSATKFRRPETPGAARNVALIGAPLVAIVGVVQQIITASNASSFVSSHDHSRHAVDQVFQGNGLDVVPFLGIAGQLALAFAFVMIALNAMRAGLLTRFMGVLGIIVGALFVLQLGATLPFVQAFWLIALAPLFAHRWPAGQPPAWLTGAAQPWPTQQELREARDRAKGDVQGTAARDARDADDDDGAAEPAPAPHPSSKKRKRKRRR